MKGTRPRSDNLKEDNNKIFSIFGCGGNRDSSKRSKMAAISEKYEEVFGTIL